MMDNIADVESGAPTLSLRGVERTFGATRALGGINLDIPRGEITALVGHNGAGKSTLLKILSGADKPDAGTITMAGQPVSFRSPADALSKGISAVYQELSLVPHLSITQNMFLGHEDARAGFLEGRSMSQRAQMLCAEFGINVDVRTPLGNLTVAQRQLAEVAAAVNRDASYLLLDEPTTALEANQIDRLLDTIARIAIDRDIGVLLVNHKLDEVFKYCNHIHAIANGRNILDGTRSTLTRDLVIDAIVGTHYEEGGERAATKTAVPAAKTVERAQSTAVFTVNGLTTKRLNDVTLSVQPGEIVGLYGLMGAGRSSFLRTLIGLYPVLGGHMTLDGSPYSASDVADAIRHRVAYVSEERKTDGIIPNLNVDKNVGITVLKEYSTLGFIKERKLKTAVRTQLAAMSTRGDLSGGIVTLSGGNQQKALLARAILQRPRLLLLDEPTKGVDIGAKAEIHDLIRQMADRTGAGVIFVSSEEEEALTLADKVHVFKDGECSAEGRLADALTISDLKSWAWLGEEISSVESDAHR